MDAQRKYARELNRQFGYLVTWLPRTLIFGLFLLLNSVQAQVKEVEINNGSKDTIRVAIHIVADILDNPNSKNELGEPIGKPTTIKPDSSLIIKRKFDTNSYINLVDYRGGTKIRLDHSKPKRKKSQKKIFFNVSEIEEELIDKDEVNKMQTFLTKQIKGFKTYNTLVIKTYDDATMSIPELLGSLMIIDHPEGIEDKYDIKKTITARQLGIEREPKYTGQTTEQTFKLSKEFTASAEAKIPAIFAIDLDFENSSLVEYKYHIKNMGTIPYKTETGTSIIDILIQYDSTTQERVLNEIATILSSCPRCEIRQVENVLAFESIMVKVKKFTWVKEVINVNAKGLIITVKGAYKYNKTNDYDYNHSIASKVIAMGLGRDLTNTISNSIPTELRNKIAKKESLINKRTLTLNESHRVLNKLNSELEELNQTLTMYQELINR